MVPFSPPWLDAQGGYSGIYCGNLVELLEVNLTALGPPRLGPLGICNSQSCRQWAASSVTVQDFLPGAGVCGSSLGVSALGDCYFLCSVSLSVLGSQVPLFYRPKKSGCFLSRFSFVIAVRMEW